MSTPPSPAEIYLSSRYCSFTKTDDGMIVVEGNLCLDYEGFSQLPDLSNVIVRGDFSCSDNNLENLKGMPCVVEGSVYCNNNFLNSLEGSPRHIGKNFDCNNNRLVTLEGGPETVGGGYNCSSNHLLILKGAPKSVGSSFFCGFNRLITMEGCPHSVPRIVSCKNNPLENLYGVPANFTDLDSRFGNFDDIWSIPADLLVCKDGLARIEKQFADAAAQILKSAVDRGSAVSAPVALIQKISLKPRK